MDGTAVTSAPRSVARRVLLSLLLVAVGTVGVFALLAEEPGPPPTELRFCVDCRQIEGRSGPADEWEWLGPWYLSWRADDTVEAIEWYGWAWDLGWRGPLSERSRRVYEPTPETRRRWADPTRQSPPQGEHDWFELVAVPAPE